MAESSRGMLPPTKEVCLRLSFVLYKAGGQLSIHRAVELLGEYFALSDDLLGRHTIGGQPKWTNFVQWARQNLSAAGFLEPRECSGWGTWRLSKQGKELGRWATAFYDERRIDLPPWVVEFLGPAKKRIRGFLRGSGAARPTDNELCRWVDLCYRLEMWPEGVEVFRRVLMDNVSNGQYATAARQARVCELRLAETNGSGPALRPGDSDCDAGALRGDGGHGCI